jgi:hypothetical protein
MKPRITLFAFVGAMLLVHGYLAFIYPLQAEDWSHYTWHANFEKESTARYVRAFFATHWTVADIAGYVVARWKLVHAILTPVATVAMVFGIFVLAYRRLPRNEWSDTLAIVLVSAMIWIAQSHTGLSFFHGPYVATHLYGATIAIWVCAAYLCRWRPCRWQQALIIFAGLFVGAASRQVAMTSLVATIVLTLRMPRDERRAWMWAAIVTIAIGTVAGFLDTPQVALKSLIARSFEKNLALGYISFREGGQLLSLLLLLALGKLVLDRLRPTAVPAAELPDIRTTIIWFGIWFWLCAVALLGPKVSSGTALPATIAICVGALPFTSWLVSTRWIRFAVIAIAIGIHVVSWTVAITTLQPIHEQFQERMRILETTPKGTIAKIPPYSVIYQDYWFFGEDWQFPGPRQLIAIRVFGLRDIEFSPSFGRNEKNPRIPIRFESSLTEKELADADAPTIWATELATARQQFDVLVRKLRRMGKSGFTMYLVVDDLKIPELRGRPVYAAWFEGKSATSPRVTRTPSDDESVYWVRVPPRIARLFPEVYAIYPDGVRPVAFKDVGYPVQPTTTQRHAVIACNETRCLALDAFSPWF